MGQSGGPSVCSSEESNKKRREKMIGEKNPNFGRTPSEETKQKQREKMNGKMVGEKNQISKKVICMVTNKIYECVTDAAKDNGLTRPTLSRYLTGKRTNKSSLRFL
jgi:hypothetical protein